MRRKEMVQIITLQSEAIDKLITCITQLEVDMDKAKRLASKQNKWNEECNNESNTSVAAINQLRIDVDLAVDCIAMLTTIATRKRRRFSK